MAPGPGDPRDHQGLLFGLPAAILFAVAGLLVAGPAMALVYGLSTGIAGCVAHALGTRSGPLRVEVRFRGTGLRFLARFATGILISLAIAFAWSLPIGALVVLATVFGFGMGVHVWLESPAEANLQDRLSRLGETT